MKNQVVFTFIGIFFLGMTSFAQTTYKVGDLAQGGIVFWVDETGQHGLVVAEEPVVGDFKWMPYVHSFGFFLEDGIYAGKGNSEFVNAVVFAYTMSSDPHGNILHSDYDRYFEGEYEYVFGVCKKYTVTQNGQTYSDWYVPSITELKLLSTNFGEAIMISDDRIYKFNPGQYILAYSSNDFLPDDRYYSLDGMFFGVDIESGDVKARSKTDLNSEIPGSALRPVRAF